MAGVDLTAIMQEEEELPRLTRGRASEDYDQLIEAMSTGRPHSLTNVSEQDRTKLAQKIRSAAIRAGFKVTVRYSKPTQKLYFQKTGELEGSQPEVETESEGETASSGRRKSA